jgi:hypothetical protein
VVTHELCEGSLRDVHYIAHELHDLGLRVSCVLESGLVDREGRYPRVVHRGRPRQVRLRWGRPGTPLTLPPARRRDVSPRPGGRRRRARVSRYALARSRLCLGHLHVRSPRLLDMKVVEAA